MNTLNLKCELTQQFSTQSKPLKSKSKTKRMSIRECVPNVKVLGLYMSSTDERSRYSVTA